MTRCRYKTPRELLKGSKFPILERRHPSGAGGPELDGETTLPGGERAMEASPESKLLNRFDECIRESIPVVGEFILDKHLNDMGLGRDDFTLDDAGPLMEKVIKAVEFCAGADKA